MDYPEKILTISIAAYNVQQYLDKLLASLVAPEVLDDLEVLVIDDGSADKTADIALMSEDLSKIPYIKRLSDATIRTITFSIALSMAINCIAIILSLLEVLTPTTGALVHNVGSCLVVLIAARLDDRKFI